MINLYTWLVGLILFALEGALLALFGIDGWALQTAIVMTILVAFEREFVPGALMLAFWLMPIELFAAGPVGHYSAGLVVVFFVARLVGPSIQGGGVPRFVAAFVATLLHGLVVAGTFFALDPSSQIGRAVMWQLLPAAFVTATTTLAIGYVLAKADDRLFPERKKRGLMGPI